MSSFTSSDSCVYLGNSYVSFDHCRSLFQSIRCPSCNGPSYNLCNRECFLYCIYVVENSERSCFDCVSFCGRLLARFPFCDSNRSFVIDLVRSFSSSESLIEVLVEAYKPERSPCNVA